MHTPGHKSIEQWQETIRGIKQCFNRQMGEEYKDIHLIVFYLA